MPFHTLLLLAETTDPNAGLLGWVTAATTAGLLGPMLYWLCYVHLPSKDAQIKTLVDGKDKAVKDLIDQHNEEREAVAKERAEERAVVAKEKQAMLESCARELKEEREICERRHAELIEKSDERHKEMLDAWTKTHEVVRGVKHEVANLAQIQANLRALEKATQKQRGGQP